MGIFQVKGGTPSGTETLCRLCSHGHVIKGFRLMEEEIYCRSFYIERKIPFAVRECSFFEDKRIASKSDMEEIAWSLTTRKAGRSVGFVTAAKFRDDEEQEEAAKSSFNDTDPTIDPAK